MLFAAAVVTFERAQAKMNRGLAEGVGSDLEMIDTLNSAYRLQGRPCSLLPRNNGYAMTIETAFMPLLEHCAASTTTRLHRRR